MFRRNYLGVLLVVALSLTACQNLDSGPDANAPWKGTWVGSFDYVDGSYPVRSTITAQIAQQGGVVSGTVMIRTATTDPSLTYDTTLRGSLSAVLVGANETEAVGSLACVSMTGTVATYTFTSCSELPSYVQNGSFEAGLLSLSTIRASLPDYAGSYPVFGNILLSRQ